MAIFLLKILDKHLLTAEFNFRCLISRNPLYNLLKAYEIIDTNLTNLLEIKYYTNGTTKKMIIAPFGKVLYFLRTLKIVE